MKCIKQVKAGKSSIVRVTDNKAEKLVKSGQASYVSKSEWKEAGRNR